MLCRLTKLISIGIALAASVVTGCSGQSVMDLGEETSPKVLPDPEAGAPAEVVFDVSQAEYELSAIAVGKRFLYVALNSPNTQPTTPPQTHLWICEKDDCARTAQASTLPYGTWSLLERSGHLILLGTPDYVTTLIARCEGNECSEPTEIVPRFYGSHFAGVGIDDSDLYWPVPNENAVYRCSLPACSGGPQLFAVAYATDYFDADGAFVYWSGRLPPELGLSASPAKLGRLAKASTDPRASATVGPGGPIVRVQGGKGFIFSAQSPTLGPDQPFCESCAVLDGGGDGDREDDELDGAPSDLGDKESNIWRFSFERDAGVPVALLPPAPAGLDQASAGDPWWSIEDFSLLGRDLLWTLGDSSLTPTPSGMTHPSALWRCDQEACSITAQPMGLLTPHRLESPLRNVIVADDDFIYWPSIPPGVSNPGTSLQVRRVPRFR